MEVSINGGLMGWSWMRMVLCSIGWGVKFTWAGGRIGVDGDGEGLICSEGGGFLWLGWYGSKGGGAAAAAAAGGGGCGGGWVVGLGTRPKIGRKIGRSAGGWGCSIIKNRGNSKHFP